MKFVIGDPILPVDIEGEFSGPNPLLSIKDFDGRTIVHKGVGILSAIRACEGINCIYFDGTSFDLVKLVKVSGNSDYVDLSLEMIEGPGFKVNLQQGITYEIRASFDYLTLRRGYMMNSMPNWTFVTDKDLVDHFMEFASTMPTGRSVFDEFRKMRKCDLPILADIELRKKYD